jgi:hypothetical protein
VTNSGADVGGIGREEVLVAGVEAPSEVEEEEDEALASGIARCRRLGSSRVFGATGSESEAEAEYS